jgi:hypothetical protein
LGPSFGTFRTLPKEEIVYGIDTHMRIEEHNELKNLLKIPFNNNIQQKRTTEHKKIVLWLEIIIFLLILFYII